MERDAETVKPQHNTHCHLPVVKLITFTAHTLFMHATVCVSGRIAAFGEENTHFTKCDVNVMHFRVK